MGVDPFMCGPNVAVGSNNLPESCSVCHVFASGYLGLSEMLKYVQRTGPDTLAVRIVFT